MWYARSAPLGQRLVTPRKEAIHTLPSEPDNRRVTPSPLSAGSTSRWGAAGDAWRSSQNRPASVPAHSRPFRSSRTALTRFDRYASASRTDVNVRRSASNRETPPPLDAIQYTPAAVSMLSLIDWLGKPSSTP